MNRHTLVAGVEINGGLNEERNSGHLL